MKNIIILFLLALSLNSSAQSIGPAGESSVYKAKIFSILPDGTNQAANFAAAIAAIPAGGVLDLERGKTYTISSTVTINKAITLQGNDAIINYTGSTGTSAINITASNVKVQDLSVKSTYGTYVDFSYLIRGSGASNTNRIRNIEVTNCTLTDFAAVAIRFQYVDNFKIKKNTIDSMPYGGIIVYSCSEGLIEDNEIDHITSLGTPSTNAYGIAVNTLSTDSVSRNVTITKNTVRNVILWEGIDTHGGRGLIISYNTLLNNNNGIIVVNNSVAGSARGVSTIGNYIESYYPGDGSAINYNGAGSTSDPATGVIVGNVMKGQGIKVKGTNGIQISGNSITEPSNSTGIIFNGDNLNAICTNNTITDVWGPSSTNTSAISYANDGNKVHISGNALVNGTFTAPSGTKNRYGMRGITGTTDEAYVGWNDWSDAATAPFLYVSNTRTRYLTNYGTKVANITTSAIYSVAQEDRVIYYEYATGGTSITLPTNNALNDGRELIIVNNSSGTLTTSIAMFTASATSSSTIAAGAKVHLTYDYANSKIWRD